MKNSKEERAGDVMGEDITRRDGEDVPKRDKGERKETGKEKRKRRGTGRGVNGFLHFLQHCALVIGVVALVIVHVGYSVKITAGDGRVRSYGIDAGSGFSGASDFEDSQLFLNLFEDEAFDVLRYGVIKSQMETNGVFDPAKEVDVTAFANRYTGVPTQYITARYRLEDLLNWVQYGFEKNTVDMTGQEVESFLSDGRTITVVDGAKDNYAGSTVSYLESGHARDMRVSDVSGNLLSSDGEEGEGGSIRDNVTAKLLSNRYQTVDGKNIEDQVFTWDEYYQLCDNLEAAAGDLAENYSEYWNYTDYYAPGNSNVVFYIQRTVGGSTEVFTNQTGISYENAIDGLKEMCGKYLIYEPGNLVFESNLSTDGLYSYMQHVFGGMKYAYPDSTRIFIGVKSAISGTDSFAKAMAAYKNMSPYYWRYLGVGVLAVSLYLFLLLLLTLREGRIVRRDTGEVSVRLCQEDRIPTEIMLALGALAASLLFWLGLETVAVFLWKGEISYNRIALFEIGAFAALVSLVFSFFYYSFVRRWKARTLWENSLCRRLFAWGKKCALALYDNGTVVLRVWVPFGLFAAVNALLLLLTWESGGLTLLLALLLNAAAGVLLYRGALARQKIVQGIQRINGGDREYKIEETGLHGDNLVLAQAVNSIGEGISSAVATSMKDERMKADLITNVSHDIKTPLTSIINYVDLIKRENVENPKVREYIAVLDAKSQRLKQLTDDLVEASKISSGNIVLQLEKIDLTELMHQAIGEFSEKFDAKALLPVLRAPEEEIFIEADSRRIWRVMENLFNNVCKYALPGTRVYIDIERLKETGQVTLSVMNISENPLKVSPNELTERFIRGDESRTTEGSGLGLSIAKNLTEVQRGSFEIRVEGDLFKVILTFPQLLRK